MGMFVTMILSGPMRDNAELQGFPAFMMVAFFVIMMVFALIVVIGMPIYYLLAGVGGFRVIRGHHFRYPILGKIIEQKMKPPQQLESA
jgi:hypothetical protein